MRSRRSEPGIISAISGNSDEIELLLRKDHSIISRRYPSLNIGTTAGRMLTLKGATLLHVAVQFCQVRIAEQLLDAGANIDARVAARKMGVWPPMPWGSVANGIRSAIDNFHVRSPIGCSHPWRFAGEDWEFERLSILALCLLGRLRREQNLEEPVNGRFGCLFRV